MNSKNALENLLEQRITLFCCRYIYTGRLVAVDHLSATLADGGIVYETGDLKTGGWRDYQPMPGAWHVMLSSVESFGVLK